MTGTNSSEAWSIITWLRPSKKVKVCKVLDLIYEYAVVNVQCKIRFVETFNNSGGQRERVPPVPIPNTEVKPFIADSTWMETSWEGRSSPDPLERLEQSSRSFFYTFASANNLLRWARDNILPGY